MRRGHWYACGVEIAAVVVAVVAAGISAWALVYAARADRRQTEQARREQRRAEREDAEARERHEALPRADYLGHSDGQRRRVYRFRTTNTGGDTASDTHASFIDAAGELVEVLVHMHTGDEVERPFQALPTRVLMPKSSVDFEMSVKHEDLKRGPFFLRFQWSDKSGDRNRTSGVAIPTG
jgi:hypothetical protein